jgi:hypothetical protein
MALGRVRGSREDNVDSDVSHKRTTTAAISAVVALHLYANCAG